MKNKFHGVFSILLIFITFGLATYILIKQLYLGWLYIPLVFIGFLAIVGVFCTKCAAAPNNCSHVFIGYLTKLFPKRNKTEYKSWEYAVTVITLFIIIGIPQYWLWNNIYFFIAFWGLFAIAVLEINSFACINCQNKKCAMCKSKIEEQ